MVLRIIKNNKIKSNQKHFDKFLEKFHDNSKEFTIDCESINLDYFNSESIITIRHRKPSKDSIYYANIYKDKDEFTYFFGLARDPVIATSSYMDMGAQIVPKLVAILNVEDSSKSSLVFAEDSEEFNNVILLRIDCSQLSEMELTVLKNKNKITRLEDGKGFINFGAIGDFNTLRNIRNFISNVDFEYDNGIYSKIIRVSIPSGSQFAKPDFDVLKDRFYNFANVDYSLEEVIDTNLEKENNNDSLTKINSKDYSNSILSSDEEIKEDNLNAGSKESGYGLGYALETEEDNLNAGSKESGYGLGYALETEEDNLNAGSKESGDGVSSALENMSDESDIFMTYLLEDNEIYLEMSIEKNNFFKIMKLLNTLVDSYISNLNQIEVLDLDDGLLNITSSILTNNDETIKIIEEILINYGFSSV